MDCHVQLVHVAIVDTREWNFKGRHQQPVDFTLLNVILE